MNGTPENPGDNAAPETPAENSVVEVADLDQFVRILVGWHTDKCQKVKHLLEVPEGTTFEIGNDELVLEGPALAGFKFGVELALMQLGHLPFVAQTGDAPPVELDGTPAQPH